MRKFLFLFGPQAVGKMTVGEELSRQTGLKLFHNHMTIELVAPFFSYGSAEGKRLVGLFRREIFEAMARSDQYGLIFTFVWALDCPEDWAYVRDVLSIFEPYGTEVYFAELEADLDTRRERNESPHRLREKPTKRNLEFTRRDMEETMRRWRLNSLPGEIPYPNYVRIDNTRLSPEETARRIREAFSL